MDIENIVNPVTDLQIFLQIQVMLTKKSGQSIASQVTSQMTYHLLHGIHTKNGKNEHYVVPNYLIISNF